MNSRAKIKSVNTLTPIMPPGIRPGEIPPFHELGEYRFQELCRDIFDTEPGISMCEVYGPRGQSQYGIDLLAHRQNGIEVGQCKCYKSFPAARVKKASEEFFEHWDRWSKENVKRFILFVTCDLSKTQQQDEIIVQKKCFKSYGIAYEAWSAAKIRNKLRPRPDIVSTYCTPAYHWMQVICGQAAPPSPWIGEVGVQPSVLVQGATISDVEKLALQMSGEMEQRLELMRGAWREGKREEPVKWVKDLRENEARWQIISPGVKAKVLRFQASLELDITRNVVLARQLADEAKRLSPHDNDSRLRALIAYQEDGPEAALKLLEGQEDVESLNLKAAFLLELGRLEACQTILNFASGGLESNV
jgi:hypothetical protein